MITTMKNKSISLRLVFEDAVSLYKKYFISLFVIFSLVEVTNIPFYTGQFDRFFAIYFIVGTLMIFPFSYAISTLYIDRKDTLNLLGMALRIYHRFIPLLLSSIIFLLLLLLGFIAFIIPFFFVSIIFSQVFYFILLENKGVLESFSLSRVLTKGNRLRILPIVILGFIPLAINSIYAPPLSSGFYNIWLGLFNVISGSFFLVIYYSLWRNLRAASS